MPYEEPTFEWHDFDYPNILQPYIPNVWSNGDEITVAKLNYLEQELNEPFVLELKYHEITNEEKTLLENELEEQLSNTVYVFENLDDDIIEGTNWYFPVITFYIYGYRWFITHGSVHYLNPYTMQLVTNEQGSSQVSLNYSVSLEKWYLL